MRVVQLITQDGGGPVDHAVDVACELARRGHESHLLGPTRRFAARLAAAGACGHDVAMSSMRDLRGGRELVHRLGELRPDVLHCQDRRAGLIGRAAGRARRVPALVYTLHGVPDGLSDLVEGNVRAAPRRRRDALYYLAGERWLSRVTRARVVVPSRAVARYAVEQVQLPASMVDVVANGVDVTRFAPGARSGAVPTALWVGLMGTVKRLDVLVDALPDVPHVQVILAGTGPEQDAVRRAVAANGLAGRVRFAGVVADPAPLFATAELFVLTSAAENCPLALLQAMSAGAAVVATAVGGIPELVRDGIDGLLVPPGDPIALAKALRTLTDDPAAMSALGANARTRVCQQYTISHCVDGLLDSYDKAAACAS